jgi:hypothetical protein
MPAFSSVTYLHVAGVKAVLALAALILLLWWWREDRRGRIPHRRLRNFALAAIGLVALAGWWNFGRFHFGGGYIHVHEFFHYYVNAKYFPELGYTGLYECVATVETQQGRGRELPRHWIRDLTTNELRLGSPAISNPALCRDRFETAERWDEFTHDVTWFMSNMNAAKRADILTDHGYNGTPVWAIAGKLLADTGPVSRSKVLLLALIDPVLLLLTLGLVWRAFGWQVLCVAMIWLGTNYPARFNFTGGAFLRQDWLFLAIGAICFARRGRMTAAGFALTWSALLRIFPAIIVLGLVIKAVLGMWRARRLRLDPAHQRFALGALAALILLFPLSLTTGGPRSPGLSEWIAFANNSKKLIATPLTNHVGLPVVVAFEPSNRSVHLSPYWLDSPWDTWKEGRRRVFQERYILYVVLVLGFVVLLARAVDRREDWLALVMGIGAIPILTQLTSYYYVVLLGCAFLWPRHPIAGIGLTLTALLSVLAPALLTAEDDRYTLISAGVVLFVAVLTFAVGRRRDRTLTAGEASSQRLDVVAS